MRRLVLGGGPEVTVLGLGWMSDFYGAFPGIDGSPEYRYPDMSTVHI